MHLRKAIAGKLSRIRYVLFGVFATNMFVIVLWIFSYNIPSSQFNYFDNISTNNPIYFKTVVAQGLSERISESFPVDIVYTWVNGSDPVFMNQMEKQRHPMEIYKCGQQDCVSSPYYYIRQAEYDLAENGIIGSLSPRKANSSSDEFWIFRIPSNRNIYEVSRLIEAENPSFSPQNQLFWNLDSTITENIAVRNAFIIQMSTGQLSQKCLLHLLGTRYLNIHEVCDFQFIKDMCIVDCNSAIDLTETFSDVDGITIRPAFISIRNSSTPSDKENDNLNRFNDNNELLYSLRSVEKYMPWARNVFIVTNGQIPRWLNLDHPKLKVITHEEIFADKSHLPTFSSDAIEANLHRIPGLSANYLYFNDDMLLTDNIALSDFYSFASGYKIYMAYNAFLCDEGCQVKSLNNGRCDRKCNSELCNFDGGDCPAKLTGVQRGTKTSSLLCSPNCLDSYLGNSKCDQDCNTQKCGYDAGDCGTQHMREVLPEILVSREFNNTALVPNGSSAGWVDFGRFANTYTMEPQYPLDDGIKAVSIIAKANIAVIVFDANFRSQVLVLKFIYDGNTVNKYFIMQSETNKIEKNNECDVELKPIGSSSSQDTYVGSIKHANKMLNDRYGYKQRKVPAHLPYFINKKIVQEIHERWPLEFDNTSANKFRSVKDVQFSFFYYNYIMEETSGNTALDVFNAFDLDHSGSWTPSEINQYAERFHAPSQDDIWDFQKLIKDCCQISQCDQNINLHWKDVQNCNKLEKNLVQKANKPKYKSAAFAAQSVSHFLRVSSDTQKVSNSLKSMKLHNRKFVCINNDTKHGGVENTKVLKLLREYYQWKFPDPSSFEVQHDSES